jgi:hypothetical protein
MVWAIDPDTKVITKYSSVSRDYTRPTIGNIADKRRAQRAELKCWCDEYGGKITKCPAVTGTRLEVWRTGYAPFRQGGAQMYCPTPDADPDSKLGRYLVGQEKRLRKRLAGTRAYLQRAGKKAESIVRRVCESVVQGIYSTEVQHLKKGLNALTIYFARHAA